MSPQLEFFVVDDNHVSLIAIRQMLEVFSIHTECSDDPYDALRRLKEKTYDMIFIDLYMPSMSGIKLCENLREEQILRDVPVIAISGNDLKESEPKLLAAGFAAVLQKPVSEQLLITCIEKNLGSRKQFMHKKQEILSTETYAKMQRLTIDQIHRFNRELTAHLMAREFNEIQKQCHALIAPLGFIHETKLCELARMHAKKPLMEELEAGNYDYYVAYMMELQDFQNALNDRALELEQAMNAYNNSSKVDIVIPCEQSLDHEEIRCKTQEIKADIKRFEYIRIVKKLNELRGILHGIYQEEINQAVSCMEQFNYDGAFKALDRLEELL